MRDFKQLTPFDYLLMLRRRVWYFIVTAVLAGALGIAYAKSLSPIYRSTTLILATGKVIPEEYIHSVDRQSPDDLIEFVRQQLQSRTFMETIVREFKFAGPMPLPRELEGAMEFVRGHIQFTQLGPTLFRMGYTSTDPTVAQAVARRLGEMVIELNDYARKNKLQVTDRFLEEQYQKAEAEMMRTETELSHFRELQFPGLSSEAVNIGSLSFLKTQLATIDNHLDSLIASRKSLDQRLNEQRMISLTSEAAVGPPASAMPAPVGAGIAAPSSLEERLAKKTQEYELALKRYTPDYPGVAALAQEVKELQALVAASRPKPPANSDAVTNNQNSKSNTIPDAATVNFRLFEADIRLLMERTDKDIAKEQQAKSDLVRKISLYEFQLNPPAAVSQQLITLTRNYDEATQNYKALRDRKLALDMAARVDNSEENVLFKIVDPANLPTFPDGPNRRAFAGAGLIVGILLGFGVVFLRELLDQSVQDEHEAAAKFGLPVLTCIPLVAAAKLLPRGRPSKGGLGLADAPDPGTGRSFHLHSVDRRVRPVMTDGISVSGEQFRLLRTTLSSLQRQRNLKTILITSAVPHEGKTFVASCLASIMAQEPGKKVLLIDADLRAGDAGPVLGVARYSTGLTDLIRGTAVLEQCIVKCAEMNLYFLPTGGVTEKPSDLLTSPELERQLEYAKELFDWIIIDSPPILAVADAKVMAPLCGATLIVVNCAQTSTGSVMEAIQRIGRDRTAGIVLNRVRKVANVFVKYYQEKVPSIKQ
jgi:succinoglycan biosynthesis transport protein ExoP